MSPGQEVKAEGGTHAGDARYRIDPNGPLAAKGDDMSKYPRILVAALFAAGLAVPAGAQAPHRAEAVEIQALIATWPAPARAKAMEMIKRNGMPDEVTDTALIWDVGRIKQKRSRHDPTLVENSIQPDSQVAEGGAD